MFDQVRADLAIIRERDPAARGPIEIILCYPGFQALTMHRLSHKLWQSKIPLKLLARILSQLGRSMTGIEIHPGARIGNGVFIDHGMGVVIGETAEVGNRCLLYQGVTLGGTGKEHGKRHQPCQQCCSWCWSQSTGSNRSRYQHANRRGFCGATRRGRRLHCSRSTRTSNSPEWRTDQSTSTLSIAGCRGKGD